MKKIIINNESNELKLLLPEDLKDKVLEVYIIPRENKDIDEPQRTTTGKTTTATT